MDRRLFLVSVSTLALAGCSGLLGPSEPPQIYILRPNVAATPQGAPMGWALSVPIPNASDDLDSPRLALTRSSTTMDYYANATWPDRLPAIVQTALVSALQDTGRFTAVSREQDALHADYSLATDLRDFAAHYSDPAADGTQGAPRITVIIRAEMVATHGRTVLASMTATQSVDASANSVDAAVQAFDSAFGAAIGQITAWALALPLPKPAAASVNKP